ncbi:MAG: molybdopterin oxidoreductase, partial [Candidatus Latescibacteria bacterium]|nr:molybdopterin oxidoreductase [Candidatus Latescibacterota bacterium]
MSSIDRDPTQTTAAEGASSKAYWRSLEDRADTPEFREMVRRNFHGREWESLPPATRRGFLKLMGASLALAGLAGCRWPREEIVPFSRPAGYVPGVPLRYATAMEVGGVAGGLLVTSFDGRPVKIEGNPEHPINRGATSGIQQAAVLELYDPDRSRYLKRREQTRESTPTWEEFRDVARASIGGPRADGGAGLRILSEATSSLGVATMRRRLLEIHPQAAWTEYEPVSRDAERAGTRMAFGEPLRPLLHFEKARSIACFDADPLMDHPSALLHAREFAAGRRADDGTMNRLFVVETDYTITGTMADHRLARPRREIPQLLRMLARELATRHHLDLAAETVGTDPGGPVPPMIRTMADDLVRNRGASLVLVGPAQPTEAHALGHALNAALGNIGASVSYARDPDPARPDHFEALASLTEEIRSGAVDTLLILGGNPAYDAPADLGFADALETAGTTTIHLSLFENETSRRCTWHLPRAHTLESWGDARSWDGTLCVQQPLIEPLY